MPEPDLPAAIVSLVHLPEDEHCAGFISSRSHPCARHCKRVADERAREAQSHAPRTSANDSIGVTNSSMDGDETSQRVHSARWRLNFAVTSPANRGIDRYHSPPMIEPILLTAARICTFDQQQRLTNASGFFFERDGRLFLVTSRHVMFDEPSKHFPDRMEIELHIDPYNNAASTGFSIPLYRDAQSIWRQGLDTAGEIDVAAIEIERAALPRETVYRAFTPQHLVGRFDQVEVGTSLLVVGFPLGFHDTLNHMPVVRQAIIASSFGTRFQGQGYFLTDARTHRGLSGAPVVMRVAAPSPLKASCRGCCSASLGTTRCRHARPGTRRDAGAELRLVRRHLADADAAVKRMTLIGSFIDAARPIAVPRQTRRVRDIAAARSC